jgi:hypothetical protein
MFGEFSKGREHETDDLRDWLAGQALSAILSNPNSPEIGSNPFDQHALSMAQQAYGYADAMLEVRSRPPTSPEDLAGPTSAP